MKQIKNTFLLGLIIFFTSCEGGTDYSFNIQNNSDQSIIVNSVIWTNDTVTNTILSGETKEIGFRTKLGGTEDEGEISGLVQYLFIETTKGKDCTKELLLHSNWILDSEHVSKIPSNYKHTYTLNLGNADF